LPFPERDIRFVVAASPVELFGRREEVLCDGLLQVQHALFATRSNNVLFLVL